MSKYLDVAIKAVKRAEEIILECYEKETAVDLKADLTPVTIADTEAQRIIIDEIKKNFPDHGFLGEEKTDKSQSASEYTWIIDPIDGTKNYIRRIPLFATQLALMHDNEIVVGVSNAPALNELLYAEKGGGCFFNKVRTKVSKINKIDEAFMTFGAIHYFEDISKLKQLVTLSRKTRGHKGFGDCWSYHLLSEGKVDIVTEGKIKIWDIAAASIIIEEAGGKMTDIYGNKIGVDTTTAVGTNGYLHDEVIDLLNSTGK